MNILKIHKLTTLLLTAPAAPGSFAERSNSVQIGNVTFAAHSAGTHGYVSIGGLHDTPAVAVPEPASAALFAVGAVLLIAARRWLR